MDKLLALLNWPTDKLQHFVVGVLIYAVLHFADPLIGLGAVAVAAVGKEIYDWLNKENHTPDAWDAVVTVAGGAVGWVCGL